MGSVLERIELEIASGRIPAAIAERQVDEVSVVQREAVSLFVNVAHEGEATTGRKRHDPSLAQPV